MPKFKLSGSIVRDVFIYVEADNIDDAIEKTISKSESDKVFIVGQEESDGFIFDGGAWNVLADGEEVDVTDKEYKDNDGQ